MISKQLLVKLHETFGNDPFTLKQAYMVHAQNFAKVSHMPANKVYLHSKYCHPISGGSNLSGWQAAGVRATLSWAATACPDYVQRVTRGVYRIVQNPATIFPPPAETRRRNKEAKAAFQEWFATQPKPKPYQS